MPRMWIRKKKGKKGTRNYCIHSFIPTCYPAKLYAASGSDADQHIRAATKEINGILLSLEKQYAGPDRVLAFLAVPVDSENDILRLDWIYQDEEFVSKADGNY
jgi:hypothetical protein